MSVIRKCTGLLCAAVLLTGAAGCKGNPEPQPTTAATSAVTVPQVTTTAAPTMPLRAPKTLGSMTMGSVYYKPEMAAAVYAVDTTKLSDSEIAMLRCLQGLVARTDSAAIYLMGTDSDRFWNTHTAEEYGIVFKEATTQELLKKYGSLTSSASTSATRAATVTSSGLALAATACRVSLLRVESRACRSSRRSCSSGAALATEYLQGGTDGARRAAGDVVQA